MVLLTSSSLLPARACVASTRPPGRHATPSVSQAPPSQHATQPWRNRAFGFALAAAAAVVTCVGTPSAFASSSSGAGNAVNGEE